MSKSSFYHFFDNKADLFRRILDEAMSPFFVMLDDHSPASFDRLNYWSRLEDLTQQATRIATETPDLVPVARMFYRTLDNPDERKLVSGVVDGSKIWLTDLIRRGQELGLVRDDLPNDLLLELVASLSMTMDRWFVTNWESLSPDQAQQVSSQSFGLIQRVVEPRQD
jgi:AcrR family transcriptional regulator